MSGRLRNKIAIITGGNSGMGFSSAKRFIEEGATVYITGRNQETIDQTVAELGPDNIIATRVDVTDYEGMRVLFERVKDERGRLDILFLNAGMSHNARLEKIDDKIFDLLFEINAKSVFFNIQAAVPYFGEDGGSIIINASASPFVEKMKGLSAYAASKTAAHTLARFLSVELASKQIRVNTISPGPVDTPILYSGGVPEPAVVKYKEKITKMTAAGRFASPDEIAHGVVYLASDESRFVVGTDLMIHGGFGMV